MKTELASNDEPRCSQEQSSPTEGHLGASPHDVGKVSHLPMYSNFFAGCSPSNQGSASLECSSRRSPSSSQPFIGMRFSFAAKLCQEQFRSYCSGSAATRPRTVPRGVCNFTGRGQQRPYTRSPAARPQTVTSWIAEAQPKVASCRSQASRQSNPSRSR